jgi:hypothetical protein
MPWLSILALGDGSRVESVVPSFDEADGDGAVHGYRIIRLDGSVREFSTMLEALEYLGEHYDVDDLREVPRTGSVGSAPSGGRAPRGALSQDQVSERS